MYVVYTHEKDGTARVTIVLILLFLAQAVVANDAAGVTLADAPASAVVEGALAVLTQGCDRRMATCSTRFGNAVNFRGEPYLPGNDLLTRYPGG